MADFLELVFRRHACTSDSSADESASFHSTECSSEVVVVGERGLNSALLFLTAVTAATELDHKVLFYTHTAIQKFPVPVKEFMTSLTGDSLKKIKFVYPRSLEELLLDLASLHEQASGAAAIPSLLLVDGLDTYLHGMEGDTRGPQREELSATAHLASLLIDTASFLNSIHENTQKGRGRDWSTVIPCRVIVSYHSDWKVLTSDPILSVLDRYFPTRCSLAQDLHPKASKNDSDLLHEWHVHLSGTGVCDAHGPQWHLGIHANGAMEFSHTRKLRQPEDSDPYTEEV